MWEELRVTFAQAGSQERALGVRLPLSWPMSTGAVQGKSGWLPAPWPVSSIQTAHCTFYGLKLRIYEAGERQRETEGRAGWGVGGGWIALITSVQAQRHCANYGPRLFLYAHFAFLSRLPSLSSARSKESLGSTTLGSLSQGEAAHRVQARHWLLWRLDMGHLLSTQSGGSVSLMDRHPC